MRRIATLLGRVFIVFSGLIVCLFATTLLLNRETFSRLSLALASSTPTAPATATPTATSTPLPPSVTPTHTPLPTFTPTPSRTPADLYISAEDIRVHPEPQIYSGDLVSFEVLPNDGAAVGLNDLGVAINLADGAEELQLGFTRVAPYGIGRRMQATFTWIWDTTDLIGSQKITVVLDPANDVVIGDLDQSNNEVELTIDVLPVEARPVNETETMWVVTESNCCIYHYTTNSAAERDIEFIIETAEEAVAYDEELLGVQKREKIVFNFVNRVVGHGGFAADTITISYLDRNYVGDYLAGTLRHEVSHVLDRLIAPERGVMITEGLAVYVAGGHFKPELISPRMAAAEVAGLDLPLGEFINDFYTAQHELSYLHAASFVEYLIDTYGWDRFRLLMRNMETANTETRMLNRAALLVLGVTLDQLESSWLESLRTQPFDGNLLADVETTVSFYDTARRYQLTADPDAYFLTAWIPSVTRAREQQIIADYTRHPASLENIALELMLGSANDLIFSGDFSEAQEWIAAVNAVLDGGMSFAVHPLALQTFDLTNRALESGYEPQRIKLEPQQATLETISEWPRLQELNFKLTESGWALSQ